MLKGLFLTETLGEMALGTVFGKVNAHIEFLHTGADGVPLAQAFAFLAMDAVNSKRFKMAVEQMETSDFLDRDSDGPDDLVFQGVRSGGPLRDNNILVRFIKPAARSMELPWVNWRSLRTSHATWLKMAGADVKDAQAQMRHSRSSTTLDIYQQFVPESQQRAVDRLSRLVN